MWDGIAVDPEPSWSTSAPATPSRGRSIFARRRSKDNLYACSIVAVDVDTGELKWHYQVVPGDNWDFDSVQQLTLADPAASTAASAR